MKLCAKSWGSIQSIGASVSSVSTSGMVSGRGNGRDQSGRGRARSYAMLLALQIAASRRRRVVKGRAMPVEDSLAGFRGLATSDTGQGLKHAELSDSSAMMPDVFCMCYQRILRQRSLDSMAAFRA
jgi:hypothetical protein